MTYDFLIDSYGTERVKVLSVWSEFTDDDLAVRPRSDDSRGRSVLEQMLEDGRKINQAIVRGNYGTEAARLWGVLRTGMALFDRMRF